MKVWFEDTYIYYENCFKFLGDHHPPHYCIDVGTKIERIKQRGKKTVYIKGEDANFIFVNVGNMVSRVNGQDPMLLDEWDYRIPTWMKEDFNRFLNTENVFNVLDYRAKDDES